MDIVDFVCVRRCSLDSPVTIPPRLLSIGIVVVVVVVIGDAIVAAAVVVVVRQLGY